MTTIPAISTTEVDLTEAEAHVASFLTIGKMNITQVARHLGLSRSRAMKLRDSALDKLFRGGIQDRTIEVSKICPHCCQPVSVAANEGPVRIKKASETGN